MKFWAAIVDPGQRVKVEIDYDEILHLSQISLGEVKKEKSNHVNVFMHHPKEDNNPLVLSTLITDKLPQQQLDLIFSETFEVSHNWKYGTVFLYGYKTDSPFLQVGDEFESDSESESESESDEENITIPDEGKPDVKVKEAEKPAETKQAKAAKDAVKQVKIVEPSPVKTDDGDSSDEDDSEDSSDEDVEDSDSEELSDSDDSEEEEETPEKKEETPKKVQSAKKRASTSAADEETPQAKKAKLITPQKTGDKESKKSSVHVATPYPKAGKTSAASKAPQTPKSAGSHTCKSCNKTFNSETAIASHNKAKHSAGK